MIKYFNVCVSENIFILPSFLRSSLAWYIFLMVLSPQPLPPHILRMFHSCLALMVSRKRSTASLMLVPLHKVPFPWLLLIFFFLSLVLSNLIMMCLGVAVFMFLLLEACWDFWICGLVVFIIFGKISTIIFLHYLFCHHFPSCTYLRALEVVPKITDTPLFLFFSSFFLSMFYFR